MATTYYSTDDDLRKIRPKITSLGVGSWEDQHLEAFSIINRTLIARWYKVTAPKFAVDWLLTEFSADRVDETQLVKLSCYKTLEIAYEYLMKDTPESDGFDRQRKLYGKKYSQELKEVLAIGVSYDWNADDTVGTDEKYTHTPRRIYRA
jgi:hypothetical protein